MPNSIFYVKLKKGKVNSMIYGYARVSTVGQAKDGNSLEAQEKLLKENGVEKIFIDTFTGTKIERPELNKLLSVSNKGDTIVVTKLDRLGRSLSKTAELINELMECGITINVLNLGVLSNNSTNTLLRNMLLAFAQFERDLIVERTMEGKAIAKTREGYREGRPKKFNKEQIELAMQLLKEHTYKEVENMTGISKSTLIRAKKCSEL